MYLAGHGKKLSDEGGLPGIEPGSSGLQCGSANARPTQLAPIFGHFFLLKVVV